MNGPNGKKRTVTVRQSLGKVNGRPSWVICLSSSCEINEHSSGLFLTMAKYKNPNKRLLAPQTQNKYSHPKAFIKCGPPINKISVPTRIPVAWNDNIRVASSKGDHGTRIPCWAGNIGNYIIPTMIRLRAANLTDVEAIIGKRKFKTPYMTKVKVKRWRWPYFRTA